MPLTAKEVENAKPREKSYRLADGKGLYLQVMPNGSRYWRYNYIFAGRQKTRAYGPYPAVSLATARELHCAAKDLLDRGVDPSAVIAKPQSDNDRYAFKVVALEWYKTHESSWTTKHAAQIYNSFDAHVYDAIGERDIRTLERSELVELIKKIQAKGIDETAYRLSQRIGSVFDYAIDIGLIKAHPASHLVRVLSARPKAKSHAAIPKKDLPELLHKIEKHDGDDITRVGLLLLAHTFVRTNELIGAQWDEFDLDQKIWVVPEERMKMKRPHVVPLTDRTCALLSEAREMSARSKYVLGAKRDPRKHISNNAMLFALYRMGYHGRMTGHGFRALASTALNEAGFNRDAIERQLAHEEADAVRAAYNRAEFLDERVKFMGWWSNFLDAERARHTA